MLKKIQGFRGTKEANNFMSSVNARLQGAGIFPEQTAEKKLDLKLNPPKIQPPSLG